ncbi:MAG TPA: glycoside hydrolase family 3 protein, partial [Rectinemataceae bacterium]|nr:glycoside hydrolase family 3 protein [Rectinemataceae bacterium]
FCLMSGPRMRAGQGLKAARELKKGLFIIFAAVFIPFCAVGQGKAGSSPPRDFWSEPDLSGYPAFLQEKWASYLVASYVKSMADEEVLSQVLMVGYAGIDPSSSLLRWVETWGIGGIKIFGWNAEDTTALANAIAVIQKKALERKSSLPVLVATDQEGGWIRHVKGRTSESPGNMAIGATASVRDAYLAGFHIGKELRVLGITMNFAPDIDLATNPDSPIIGPRAFSDDPTLVSKLGLAYARGSLAAGVIPTAKHYPGHGATSKDSHGSLPVIDIDESTLLGRELVPFSNLVREGIPAIMSGHLAFPRVTGSEEPASLSKTMITDYLRRRLGYKGLVITDDLYMVGALGDDSILETCVKALMAGNDMILLSAAPDLDGALWKGLLARYRADEAFRKRVKEAASRGIALKLRHLRPLGVKGLVPDSRAVARLLPDPEAQVFFRDLARRSVSLVGRGELPFLPKGKVMIAGPFDTFVSIGRRKYDNSTSYHFSYRPENSASQAELDDFKTALAGCEAAIVCVANKAGLQFANAAHDAGLNVAIVSVLSPINAKHSSWARAIVAVYHYAPVCLEAGFEALLGEIPAAGRVPLSAKALR